MSMGRISQQTSCEHLDEGHGTIESRVTSERHGEKLDLKTVSLV
jgi:hypothetical protein